MQMRAATALLGLANWMLLACLLAAPWLNGGADAFFRRHLFVGVAATWALLLAGTVLSADSDRRLPSVAIVLFAAIGLCAWHLSPIHQLDAPTTRAVQFRAEMTPADLLGEDLRVEHTLDPTTGRTQFASLFMGVAVFLAAYELFADRHRSRRTYLLLSANAVAITFFALMQRYDGSGRLYGVFQLPVNETAFGPFVYHNMAGVFLAMSLPAALYFLLSAERSKDSRLLASPTANFRAVIAGLTGRGLLGILATVVIVVGLLTSLSRGAMLVAVAAGAITWITFLWRTRRNRNVFFGGLVIAVAAAAMISFVGSDQVVSQRIASLSDEALIVNETRLPVWRDSLTLISDFPWLGGGLGSYGLLNAQYRTFDNPFWWTHAHNQYLEALADTGVLGLSLLVALIALTIACAVIAMRRIDAAGFAMVAVCWFAVIVGVLHSAIDYCLYLPSTFFLFAAFCGMLFALTGDHAPKWLSIPVGKRLKVASYLCVLIGVFWGAYDTRAEAQVELALKRIPWQQARASLNLDQVDQWITELEQATSTRDHVLAREALAELYFTRYRVQSAGILASELAVPRDDPNLWDWTLPVVLHHRVHTLRDAGDREGLADIREQVPVRESLRAGIDQAIAGLRISPLLPRLYSHLEEAEFLLEGAAFDGSLLRRAALLDPNDAELLFECGRLHFSAGRYDAAYEVWKQCLTKSEELGANVIRLASQHLTVEELLQRVIPNSPELLVSLAESTFEQAEDRKIVLALAHEQLRRGLVSEADRHHLQARMRKLNAAPHLAIAEYRQAIALAPQNCHWRRELVRLLLQENRINEAEREAWLCTQIEPNVPRNISLLTQARQRQSRTNP